MVTAAPAAAAASVAEGVRSPAAAVTGFIGIGNMGLAMALRLCELGWPVRVRDLESSREAMAARAGATVCATPAALAAGCARVVIAVVDAAQSEDVLFGRDGAAASLAQGSAVLLCPTIAPQSTEAIAARLAAVGIDCLDAPMSGGPAKARDGSMSLMVACPDAVFARHRDLLEALSSKVFRVGTRAGDGARTKLVNNLLAAINLAGAAEALALAERVGLDPARTLAVIEQSSGQSWIGSDRLPRALAGDLAPRAHTTLLAKDSALAVSMARAAGFETRLGQVAASAFAGACEVGWGGFDDGALLDFLRGVDAPAPISATTAGSQSSAAKPPAAG